MFPFYIIYIKFIISNLILDRNYLIIYSFKVNLRLKYLFVF